MVFCTSRDQESSPSRRKTPNFEVFGERRSPISIFEWSALNEKEKQLLVPQFKKTKNTSKALQSSQDNHQNGLDRSSMNPSLRVALTFLDTPPPSSPPPLESIATSYPDSSDSLSSLSSKAESSLSQEKRSIFDLFWTKTRQRPIQFVRDNDSCTHSIDSEYWNRARKQDSYSVQLPRKLQFPLNVSGPQNRHSTIQHAERFCPRSFKTNTNQPTQGLSTGDNDCSRPDNRSLVQASRRSIFGHCAKEEAKTKLSSSWVLDSSMSVAPPLELGRNARSDSALCKIPSSSILLSPNKRRRPRSSSVSFSAKIDVFIINKEAEQTLWWSRQFDDDLDPGNPRGAVAKNWKDFFSN